MRILRTAALGAAVVMAAAAAVGTQSAANKEGLLMKSALFTWESVPEQPTAQGARRGVFRGADRDARRARVPQHDAEAGRIAACAAHPPERGAAHRQGRRRRSLRQRRVEAGADGQPDLLRLERAAYGAQRRHGAGDLPRGQLGRPRQQEEAGGEVSRGARALATAAALAAVAALGIGSVVSLSAQTPAAPSAAAGPVNNAAPTPIGPAIGYFEATADLGLARHQGLHRLRRRHPDLHVVGRRHQHVGRTRRVPVRVAEDERRLPDPHPREVRRQGRRPPPQDRRHHPQGARGRCALRRRHACTATGSRRCSTGRSPAA